MLKNMNDFIDVTGKLKKQNGAGILACYTNSERDSDEVMRDFIVAKFGGHFCDDKTHISIKDVWRDRHPDTELVQETYDFAVTSEPEKIAALGIQPLPNGRIIFPI